MQQNGPPVPETALRHHIWFFHQQRCAQQTQQSVLSRVLSAVCWQSWQCFHTVSKPLLPTLCTTFARMALLSCTAPFHSLKGLLVCRFRRGLHRVEDLCPLIKVIVLVSIPAAEISTSQEGHLHICKDTKTSLSVNAS